MGVVTCIGVITVADEEFQPCCNPRRGDKEERNAALVPDGLALLAEQLAIVGGVHRHGQKRAA